MQGSTKPSRTHSFSSKDIGQHYDQFAWAYRRYWGDHIHHGLFVTGDEDSEQSQRLMLQHCASRAGVHAGMMVADVGCGHGGTVNLLAGEYGCSVLGLTISGTQLRLARKACESLNGKVRFELADAEAYDFQPASLDLIWNMESTEHFFDKPAYFRRVAGALKPGGKLVTLDFVPNEDRVSPPMAAGFSLTMLTTTPSGDAYTFRELESMYSDAGFVRVTSHPVPTGPHTVVMGYNQ